MNFPRILPLVGVAVGGVLAVKALSGVTALPDMLQGARAFAEGLAPAKTDAPVLPPGLSPKPPPGSAGAIAAASAQPAQSLPPRLACGPTAADLAKQAGLSPAELQILQSLGTRRGQLDQREQDLDVQLRLLAAAESKLDGKLAALASLKTNLQGLLTQADQQKATEIDRLVTIYAAMKPADAAARMSLIDDSVRLPIAAKMKERALSAILGKMAPADAKAVTEKLAQRYESKALADARSALAPPVAPPGAVAAPAAQTAPPADKTAAPPRPARRAAARRAAKPATALAANPTAAAPKPAAGAPAAGAAASPTATPAPPAKAG